MNIPLLPAFVGRPEVNRVYNVSAETMLDMLPDNHVDLVVTSPPYDNLRTYKGFSWDFEYIARQTYRVLKPGGVLVWVVGDATIDGSETLTSFEQALYFKKSVGFRVHDTMIWEKSTPYPSQNRYYHSFDYMFVFTRDEPKTFNPLLKPNKTAGRTINGSQRDPNGSTRVQSHNGENIKTEGVLSNIWPIDGGYMRSTKDIEAYEHPAMFPETLAERHILTWSNPGDLVLDFFGGSGTTAKMARLNGRNYLTNDISREYCDLMERRLAMPYTLSFLPALEAKRPRTHNPIV